MNNIDHEKSFAVSQALREPDEPTYIHCRYCGTLIEDGAVCWCRVMGGDDNLNSIIKLQGERE